MMTAELDFDAREATVITFGTEGVPRSQTITRETLQGFGGALPGEAGTDSNIPGYVFSPTTGDVDYERNDETINYEINETTERQIRAPGRLDRLHAAVVVNEKGGQLTQRQLEQIQEVVASAIGYQIERGDSISVQGMDFDTSQFDEARNELEQARRAEQINRYVTQGAVFLAFLIVFITVLRIYRAKREQELEAQLAAMPAMPEISMGPVQEAAEEETEERRLHNRVRQLAEKEPDAVAYLIRAWLAEE